MACLTFCLLRRHEEAAFQSNYCCCASIRKLGHALRIKQETAVSKPLFYTRLTWGVRCAPALLVTDCPKFVSTYLYALQLERPAHLKC